MKLPANSEAKPLKRGQVVLNLRSGKRYECISSSSKDCAECAGTGKGWVIKLRSEENNTPFVTSLKRLAGSHYEVVVSVIPKDNNRKHIQHGVNKKAVVKLQQDKAAKSEAQDQTIGGKPTVKKTSRLGRQPRAGHKI